MIGTFEVQPQGKVIPRIKRIGMRFGAPLDFSRYAGLEDDRFVLRSMTDEIMYELMLLSNQEYVDIYAAKAKADLAAARKAESASVADLAARVTAAGHARPGADPRGRLSRQSG